MSRIRVWAITAVLAFVAASCGGGGEVSESTTPDTTDDQSTATTVPSEDAPPETEPAPAGGNASAIAGLDINPCSVLSESDRSDLDVEVSRLGGAAKGMDASNLALFPTCEWSGSTRYEVEIGPGDLYSGEDAGLVGDRSSLSTTMTGDPELNFVSGDVWYRLNSEGSGDETADQNRLVDVAARIIANEEAHAGLMDGLASAAVFGGPDVVPCEVIDAQALADWIGFDAYVVHPSERVDRQEFVECTISGGAINFVSLLISAGSIYSCDDEIDRRDVGGVEVCVGTGAAGIGTQAVAQFPDYQVLLITSSEPSGDVADGLFEQVQGLLESF